MHLRLKIPYTDNTNFNLKLTLIRQTESESKYILRIKGLMYIYSPLVDLKDKKPASSDHELSIFVSIKKNMVDNFSARKNTSSETLNVLKFPLQLKTINNLFTITEH